MTILTLPGSIPNIRRLGSPVYSPRDDLHGVVVEASTGLRVHSPTEGDGYLHDIEDDWDLDLTDATGRAHAAWWLADRLYPGGEPIVSADVVPGRTIGPICFGLATCDVMDGQRWRPHPAFECTEHLSADDPRLLPDGSRWVDAEALRLVCLHVAGLSP